MAAYDNVQLPGAPDIAHAGNYAQMVMQGLQNIGESYQKGEDFRYKKRQQDLFKDGIPTDANGQPDYAAIRQKMIESGGSPVAGQMLPMLQKQPFLNEALRQMQEEGGGGQPAAENTSSPNQTAAALDKARARMPGGAPNYPKTPYSNPSTLSDADNPGGETVRTLTAGIANGRQVQEPTIANYARALGIKPDTPLSAEQEARARKIIGNNLGGVPSQSPPPATNDAASGGSPINSAAAAQGNESPVVGSGGGMPISPPPTAAAGGGGIQPSGPQVAQAPPAAGGASAGGAANMVPPGADARVWAENKLKAAETLRKRMRVREVAGLPTGSLEKQAEALEKQGMAVLGELGKAGELGREEKAARNPDVIAYDRRKALASKAGEAQGKVIGDYIEAGRSAYKRVQYLDTVGDALSRGHGNITTGPFADFALASKQALSSLFGIPFEGVAEAEVAKKTGFALATQAVKEITSRPTQMEVGQALQNNPGLLLSEKGSFLMVDVMKQAARQDAEIAKLAANPENHEKWQEVVDDYYKKHPLLSPFDHKTPLGIGDLKAIGGGAAGAPAIGHIEQGYRFKGGNPKDQKSWEPVAAGRP